MEQKELIPKETQREIVAFIMRTMISPKIDKVVDEFEKLEKETAKTLKVSEQFKERVETIEKAKEEVGNIYERLYKDSENPDITKEGFIWETLHSADDDLWCDINNEVHNQIGNDDSATVFYKINRELDARIGVLTIDNFDNIVKALMDSIDIDKYLDEVIKKK